MCEHTCYNICRHEDREGQLRFRPKLARRLIAALIAALIAGLVSGPAAIQAALEPGGHVGAARVSRPPAALTPKITAAPPPHSLIRRSSSSAAALATLQLLEVRCPTEGTKSRGLGAAR